MNWNDVTIRKGKELYELDIDPFYQKNDAEKLTQQLCIILDKDEEWVDTIPLKDALLYKEEISFLSEAPKEGHKPLVVVDGEEYHFMDLDKISLGEFADLDTNCKDAMNSLERLMSILYRKKDEKYSEELMKQRASLFLDKMSYEVALGAALFFSLFVMDSIRITSNYSMLQIMMTNWMKQQQNLKEQLGLLLVKPKKTRGRNSNGL